MLKLHIGCGKDVKSGYDNIDLFSGPIKMDVLDLKYPNNSVDEILSHHTLEHIEHYKTEAVLKEWYRVLKPGGKIIITVPDAARVFNRWLKDDDLNSFWYKTIWGQQREKGDYHFTGFTKSKIIKLFEGIGFKGIEFFDVHKRKTPSIGVMARK